MKHLKKFNQVNELWIKDQFLSSKHKDDDEGKEIIKEIDGFYLDKLEKSDISITSDEYEFPDFPRKIYNFKIGGRDIKVYKEHSNEIIIYVFDYYKNQWKELDISKRICKAILSKITSILDK